MPLPSLHLIIANRNYSSWSMRAWVFMKMSGVPFTESVVAIMTECWFQNIGKIADNRRVPILYVGDQPASTHSLPSWNDPCLFSRSESEIDCGERWKPLLDCLCAARQDYYSVTDSLAIFEHVNDLVEQSGESYPVLTWPKQTRANVFARSVAYEIHSSFLNFRDNYPFNVREHYTNVVLSDSVLSEVTRLAEMIKQCRELFGSKQTDDQGFLFGKPTIVDALMAAEVERIATYDLQNTSNCADAFNNTTVRCYFDKMRSHEVVQEWRELANKEKFVIERFAWAPDRVLVPLHIKV